MADNERQAEIEALERIAKYNIRDARDLEVRRIARNALDRVRDARHDDEAARCCCGNGEAEDDRGAVLRCPVHGQA